MVHLSAEFLMKETGIKMQHLPYKGGSNSMADLLGGTIDALFVSSPVAVGQAENKNLKMLAVTSRYRLEALPNVPTVEESGVPGFDTTAWLGVMGPAGLPPTIRQKLSVPWWKLRATLIPRSSCARSGSSRSAKTPRHFRNSSAPTSRSGRSSSKNGALRIRSNA
jgi:tripartite-type tricarboxylate transporter receptor subunit TctC